MNFHINILKREIKLTNSNCFFQGYVNTEDKLLYNQQAEEAITSILKEKSIEELFSTINGAFQFIYLKSNKLVFSVDHFGGYSLFYIITDKGIELFDNPMLHKHKSKLNDLAVCSLLATGFTLNGNTIFEDIKECIPGTLYTYDLNTGKLSSEIWFSYHATNSKSLNPQELDEITDGLFPDVNDGTYTLSLSGGIDSRFMFGCLLKREKPFHTFSFGTDLNIDKQIAEKLASQYSIPFTRFDFNPEVCSKYYNHQDIGFIINYCTFGRSLPNETDLIPSCSFEPETNIICKGFGGDFLTGRYIVPKVHTLKTFADAVNYLFEKYFAQTCISSSSFRNMLYPHLLNSVQSLYKANNKDIISTIEQWNQLHNERKYIINTLSYYKAKGYRIYLPFYDRRLVTFMAQLKYSEKTDQKAYFTYLREHFFTGKLSELRTTESLRPNFMSELNPPLIKELFSASHNILRSIDTRKLRKRYFLPSPNEYADSLMLFTHSLQTKPYLQNKIEQNFPDVNLISALMKDEGCPEASKHLNWLARQSTGQINLNGLSLCKFFFNEEFAQALKTHITE